MSAQSPLRSAIEALVFTSEVPVTHALLKQALPDTDPKEIKSALADIQESYQSEAHGVELVEAGGGWIFRTKASQAEVVSRLRRVRPARLSRAALETLSIVAYRQPVTRGGIEDIRGVDSGGVLRTLLEKRLVKILGRSEAVGNPLLYGTTPEFLQVFGLKDLNSLPTLKEFQELDDESRALLPPEDVEEGESEDELRDDDGIQEEDDAEESSAEEEGQPAEEGPQPEEATEAEAQPEEEGQPEEERVG